MPEFTGVLDQILAEVRDIRTLIEGLMQPLVTIDPTDPHHAPRPFGDRGVDTPEGKLSAEEFKQKYGMEKPQPLDLSSGSTLTAEQFDENFGNGRG